MTHRISATFHDEKDGSTKTVQVPVGQSLMEAAHANDIDLEGRALCPSEQLYEAYLCALRTNKRRQADTAMLQSAFMHW